jgi:hypothetical protein
VTQLGLLTWTPPSVSPVASPQGVELARVEGRIAEAVVMFLRYRLVENPSFFAADLSRYVTERHGGSPESPLRIMRALRRSGQVQVVNVDRAASLYRVEGVR